MTEAVTATAITISLLLLLSFLFSVFELGTFLAEEFVFVAGACWLVVSELGVENDFL